MGHGADWLRTYYREAIVDTQKMMDVLMLKEKYGLGLDLLQKAGNQLKILPHRVDMDS